MKYCIYIVLKNEDEVFLGFTEAATKEEAAEKLGLRVVMIGDKQVLLDPGQVSINTDAVMPPVHFILREGVEINSLLQLVQVTATVTIAEVLRAYRQRA